ncbi:ABC transporter permease [Microbacterium sp. ASV81]|uniref:ABC transporter permease subunit n=1 Tax=Microbacterium capsulatum TaxID=3041921 RepID=A0ABU0XJZ7_9MICO|nr:ABC transporter permease subunit [Microbacterium sp. ASV81]MDQ4214455.1 ABC transporter permease subunit [Microbacterium sp. ASV81]
MTAVASGPAVAEATAGAGRGAHSAPRARRAPAWLGAAPLLAFLLIALGLPVVAMLVGALTVTTDAGAVTLSTAGFAASFDGPYLDSLLGSIQLSAVSAGISTIVSLPLTHVVVASPIRGLRDAVLSASGVIANFGGVPLAFAFVATLGNAGLLTDLFHLTDKGWSLYTFGGLGLVYCYFLIPLMVLTLAPALDGLRPQWREAAQNSGATRVQYFRHVALPILLPTLLSGFVLLFGSAFSAYATAAAMVGSSIPLVTVKIASALTGDVLVGQGNIALALSVDMIVVAAVVMGIQLLLQRRSSAWLS